jgi:hypothetical protein
MNVGQLSHMRPAERISHDQVTMLECVHPRNQLARALMGDFEYVRSPDNLFEEHTHQDHRFQFNAVMHGPHFLPC